MPRPERRAVSRAARTKLRHLLLALVAIVIAAGGLLPVSSAHAAAAIPGLEGDGSPETPLVIDSAADLDAVAAAINGDNATFGSLNYQLGADIEYGGATFVGIDLFQGVLDGAGHRISDIVYGPSAAAASLTFFRTLAGGTVRDLTLDGVRAVSTSGQGVATITTMATGSAVIDGNAVLDSQLITNGQYAGGIASNAENGATISNNWVQGEFTSDRYPSAVAGYTRCTVDISHNLVDAIIRTSGSQANGAALLSYQGAIGGCPTGDVSVRENVVVGGAITYSGSPTVKAGRVMGTTAIRTPASAFTLTDNLVNPAFTIGGTVPTAPGQYGEHGTDASAEALAQQTTYEGIGWDFTDEWRWDAELGHPIPLNAVVPEPEAPEEGPLEDEGVPGEGSAGDPFLLDSAADLDVITAAINTDNITFGASAYRLTANVDYRGRTFTGIDLFRGTFDGAGHKIYDLTLGTSATANTRGFFRNVQGATVRGLTLDGATAASNDGSDVAILAVDVSGGSLVQGNAVLGSKASTTGQYASGLAARAHDGATIVDNWVQGSFTSNRRPVSGGRLRPLQHRHQAQPGRRDRDLHRRHRERFDAAVLSGRLQRHRSAGDHLGERALRRRGRLARRFDRLLRPGHDLGPARRLHPGEQPRQREHHGRRRSARCAGRGQQARH